MSHTDAKKPRIAIAVAVAAALVSAGAWYGWRSYIEQPADPAETAELAERNSLNTQIMQKQLDQRLTEGPLNAEQERLDSPTGQALLRKCLEWTEFHNNHPDESSQANRDDACGAYSDYIDTGVAPGKSN